MNPRNELETRYPEADFSAYFLFIEACRALPESCEKQEHHICPKKQFPEYRIGCPENLAMLFPNDHAHAHRLLGAAVPEMIMGTGWIEKQKIAAVLGGKIQGQKHKENKTGVCEHKVEWQAKGGRAAGLLKGARKRRSFAHCSAGGKKGGPKGGRTASLLHKQRGTGVYSKEFQIMINGKRLHKRWHTNRGITKQNCKWCQIQEPVSKS